MTTYTFRPVSSKQSYDWNDPATWTGGVVPNGPDADVVFPTSVIPGGFPFGSFISIKASETEFARSVTIEGNSIVVSGALAITGSLSVNTQGGVDLSGGTLTAGAIAIDGGDVEGSGSVYANTIVNASRIGGSGLIVHTGSFSNTGYVTASSGNVALHVDPGNFADGVLTGGTYEAYRDSALVLDVGASITSDAAAITLAENGTILSYDAASGAYKALQYTLHDIAPSGSLTLFRNYAFGPLTVAGAVILADYGQLASSQLTVSPGGRITTLTYPGRFEHSLNPVRIDAPINNEGAIVAGRNAAMTITGAVSGRGTLEIAAPAVSSGGQLGESAGTLEINGAVSASQTVTFGSNIGLLTLDQPAAFAGLIEPGSAGPEPSQFATGDEILLQGMSVNAVTSMSYTGDASGGTLELQAPSGSLSFRFAGKLSTANFALSPAPQNAPSGQPNTLITIIGLSVQPPRSAGTISKEIGLTYETVLGRAADAGGLAHYVAQATQQGVTLADEAANMASSTEATGRYGLQTDIQFVTQLFVNAYGSPATSGDNAGVANALVGELGRGSLTRGEVAVGVALGQQHRQTVGVDLQGGLIIPGLTGTVTADPTSPGGITELITLALFGRPASGLDLETGVQMLAGGASPADLATALLGPPLTHDFSLTSLYANAFSRAPDRDGQAHYEAALASGTSKGAVAAEIALSPEHVADVRGALDQGLYVPDPTTSGLARLYDTILGRAPDLFGLTAERHRLDGGQTLTDRAASMLASPEYAARYGTLTDQAFITDLYQNALGRAPDPGGFNGYTAKLASGTTRAAVAFEIAESAEATLHLAQHIENGFMAT